MWYPFCHGGGTVDCVPAIANYCTRRCHGWTRGFVAFAGCSASKLMALRLGPRTVVALFLCREGGTVYGVSAIGNYCTHHCRDYNRGFDALVTYDILDSALSLDLGRADPSISHWSCDLNALVNYNIRDSASSLDLGRANPSISPSPQPGFSFAQERLIVLARCAYRASTR